MEKERNKTSSNYIEHHFIRYISIIFPLRIGQSSDGNMILHFRRCWYYVNNFICNTVTARMSPMRERQTFVR